MATDKNSRAQSLINANTTTNLASRQQSFPMTPNRDSKRGRLIVQPKGTIPYTVCDNDTIEKVALRFNSTPSEIRQLNKLTSRMIFPGEILFVPEGLSSNDVEIKRSASPPPPATKPIDNIGSFSHARIRSSSASASTTVSSPQSPPLKDVGQAVWSVNRQNNARPGRAERLKSDASTKSDSISKLVEDTPVKEPENHSKQEKHVHRSLSFDEQQQIDKECLQRFIKLHVRLLTDNHLAVAGTLLITPNAIMFDPDELDPLTKIHGIDKYGLIIRMDLLAGISLFEDIGMYEREATARDVEKRRFCRSISVKSSRPSDIIIQSNNSDEEQIHDLMMSLVDRVDRELNPSSETDTCMLFDASTNLQHLLSRNSPEKNDFTDEELLSVPFDDSLQMSNDSSQPLDEYRHSIGILLDDDDQEQNINANRMPSDVSYVFDWGRFKRAVKVKKTIHLESCVPLDPFQKRFGEIDDLIYKQRYYVVRNDFEIPYYLCVRTSMHIHDIPSLQPKQYKRQSEIKGEIASGQKQLEQEYWFAVPKEKIEQLHSFFLRWTPERELDPLIDDDNEIKSKEPITTTTTTTATPQRGFVLLVDDDQESSHGYESKKGSEKTQEKTVHYIRRESKLLKEWEIVSVDEIYRRIHTSHGNKRHLYENSFAPPTFLQPSTLIDDDQAKQLLLELPARYHGLSWYMVFSTETHGFSLNQLYRQFLQFDRDLPSLLIVKDVEQNIFGAFVPRPLMLSHGFYGTGESFLFTLSPEFRVYNWSGLNEFYVKGDLHAMGFGTGDGTYGLWIDGDLNHGRTGSSKTFNSEPLTSHEDFTVASIEVWTFID